MVHRLVKVEVLNTLNEVCISRPGPLQASKATKNKYEEIYPIYNHCETPCPNQ